MSGEHKAGVWRGGVGGGCLPLLSCQPAPLLAAPSACPHMLCLLIPLIQLECGWGWPGQRGHASSGKVTGGPDHTLAILLLGFLGKSRAGETPMSTASAICR